jgi:hypothetical protein
MNANGAIPSHLCLLLSYKSTLGNQEYVNWQEARIDLYEDQDRSIPIWYIHPEYKEKVDIVAIEIENFLALNTYLVPINSEISELDDFSIYPGMDVFTVGFPLGLTAGGIFPIWKRGSIASEPDVDIEDLPKILIDTANGKGMSGSPVFVQESGFWYPRGTDNLRDARFGKTKRFLGIYSGRILGEDVLAAQLGIVWKEKAIKEIIKSRFLGSSPFFPTH